MVLPFPLFVMLLNTVDLALWFLDGRCPLVERKYAALTFTDFLLVFSNKESPF
jgi:hypothetical protein